MFNSNHRFSRWRPSATILDFYNFVFLMACSRVHGVTVRYCAKFRGNRSNHCRYDCQFFQYGGRPPSWIYCARVWTIYAFSFYRCAKLDWNRCSNFNNMHDAAASFKKSLLNLVRWRINPLDLADRQNFEMLKIHDGGGRHSDKNRKIASLTDRHHPILHLMKPQIL